ncbi:nitrous oxide reductase family maturation protein NosD [Plantactinospora solaniradicis]|uniref:Nitrous oxide reductase family maturation protein NosD n=1 Tax=Plantactinospora solaniradicis TaxID=1723736 RepID=A0ABW1K2R4_9ACTN
MRSRTLPVPAVFVALAAALVVAAGPLPAYAATPVRCGGTVTTDLTLTANLSCRGDGLIVGADGVTVNLNGHTISGSAAGTGIRAVGVAAPRIRNGVIRGFTIGVWLEATRDARLTGLQLLDNGGGTAFAPASVYADQVSGLLIQGGRIVPRSGPPPTLAYAIRTAGAKGLVVRGVDVTGLTDLSSGSNAAQVVGNTFRYGGLNLSESHDAVVRRNSFLWAGINISECNRAQVLDNVLTSGRGIRSTFTDGTLIRGNLVRDTQYGVYTDVVTHHLRVEGNTFDGNRYGVRADVHVLGELDGLLVRNNRFTANDQAGMFLEADIIGTGPARVTISDNRFTRNGYASTDLDSAYRWIDDGLHTNVPVGSAVVVARNLTSHNAEFGIEGSPVGSVRDGGGNVSTGDPAGCIGVTCG